MGTSAYHLTRAQLRADLEQAWLDARRHKGSKPYVQRFAAQKDRHLDVLCDELWTGTYRARPSSCFIITDPKPREVFAAAFRDRIVHHLYYNYVHDMLERTFIADTYSCIPGRGTHYGIGRLEQHLRSESRGSTRPCYVLKMDIRGYFMHIDRQRLLAITLDSLRRMASHRISRHAPTLWRERVDMAFVERLTRDIVLLDPSADCRLVGSRADWQGLPADKSLFCSPAGCGLPIGNLTSQLFSNVYLNVLDQHMKRTLHCTHYGRYVDDFYVVSADRAWLESLIPQVRTFLRERLALTLHEEKTCVVPAAQGVEFLGQVLCPRHRLPSPQSVTRMTRKVVALHATCTTVAAGTTATTCWSATTTSSLVTDSSYYRRETLAEQALTLQASLNSFLGVLSHTRSYTLRRRLFLTACPRFRRFGFFDRAVLHFTPYRDLVW